MLKHFKAEADKMIAESGSSVGLKVLSDVDDTLYSSGGKFPAGADEEYPKHQLYPGCLKFFWRRLRLVRNLREGKTVCGSWVAESIPPPGNR